MLMPVTEASGAVDMTIRDIGFTCSGSTDYLAGAAFSFVMTLDGVGPWPPIQESHVEMDGAWAVYEAWVKLQLGEIDSALVYCYGKSSPGDLPMVMTRQLDPYSVGPLWPDSVSLAALQARALLDVGQGDASRWPRWPPAAARRAGQPLRPGRVGPRVEELLAEPEIVAPLRKHDCPPITDGVCAVVLAADDVARELCERPAWIRGIDHRIEPMALGVRDLTTAVDHAGGGREGRGRRGAARGRARTPRSPTRS